MERSSIHGFRNREDAGRQLASGLRQFAEDDDCILLALPRGGVPVAAEIGRILNRPIDVLIVRKLGVPGHEEFAMGAIASGGVRILNQEVISQLEIPPSEVEAVIRRESEELARREARYRGGQPPMDVAGFTVIVVDDGIATGSTMSAAVQLLRKRRAGRVVVAVPVAPPDTVQRLLTEADEVITVIQPDPFSSVGRWYDDFSQTTDAEVQQLLSRKEIDPPPVRAAGKAGSVTEAARIVRRAARPLTGAADDYDDLLDWIGDASIVLLGEASHGTHEFYQQRARITRRLIEEKDFNAVAAEADWPDAYRVNRFVRGEPGDIDSVDALAGFARFPAWMWRNADMLDFTGWLRDHNDQEYSLDRQAGFYGLDLYSLHKSMDEVIAYLDRTDPKESAKAKILYSCIDRFGRDPQNYGLLAGTGVNEPCRAEVIRTLTDLSAKQAEYLARNGRAAADEFFFAEQNARLVKNAEEYYRNMFRSYVSTWNLRDQHMVETLVALMAHLQSHQGHAKVVVWAHNSHVGDARATTMVWRGEHNIGQLVREAFPGQSKTIGFTTYTGTVTAASGWHLPAERKPVVPGLDGSYEHLFHQVGIPGFWLDLTGRNAAVETLRVQRLERAIGVVYLPQSERRSHYFDACLPRQFDAVIHFDHTRAVEPLERTAGWKTDEAPETFPVGL